MNFIKFFITISLFNFYSMHTMDPSKELNDQIKRIMRYKNKDRAFQAIQKLLDAGADPNYQDVCNGNTVFHKMAGAKDYCIKSYILEIFFKFRINPFIKNNQGKTARDCARDHSRNILVEFTIKDYEAKYRQYQNKRHQAAIACLMNEKSRLNTGIFDTVNSLLQE